MECQRVGIRNEYAFRLISDLGLGQSSPSCDRKNHCRAEINSASSVLSVVRLISTDPDSGATSSSGDKLCIHAQRDQHLVQFPLNYTAREATNTEVVVYSASMGMPRSISLSSRAYKRSW